jgi:hypothetical protein
MSLFLLFFILTIEKILIYKFRILTRQFNFYSLCKKDCLFNNVSSSSTWLSSGYNSPQDKLQHIVVHREILYIRYIFQEQYNILHLK